MIDSTPKSILLTLSSAFRLPVMEVVPSFVGEEIHRPANKLSADHVKRSPKRRILCQLIEFMCETADPTCVHFSSLGNEYHVPLNVASCLMVFSVGNFP